MVDFKIIGNRRNALRRGRETYDTIVYEYSGKKFYENQQPRPEG
jgi:hypothetical protein